MHALKQHNVAAALLLLTLLTLPDQSGATGGRSMTPFRMTERSDVIFSGTPVGMGVLPIARLTDRQFILVMPDSLIPSRRRERELESHHISTAFRRQASLPDSHAGTWQVLWEDEDPGTRVTESEFLEIVRGFVAKSRLPAESPKTR